VLAKEKDKKGKARKFRIGERFISPINGSELLTVRYNKKLNVYEAASFDVSTSPFVSTHSSRSFTLIGRRLRVDPRHPSQQGKLFMEVISYMCRLAKSLGRLTLGLGIGVGQFGRQCPTQSRCPHAERQARSPR